MRARILAICVVLIALVVACGAPKSGGFSEIDRSRIPAPLTATTTTTTTTTTTIPATTTTINESVLPTTTVFVPPPTTVDAAPFTLYFVSGREQLYATEKLLARDPSAAKVMSALQAGPTGDGSEGLRSALPPGPAPNVTEDRSHGLVTVDLSATFLGDTGADQRLAIGQIVLTMTQLSGIAQVTFTEDGEPAQVQLADGVLSDKGASFHRADYQPLLTSSSPTTLPTTTTPSTPDTTDTSGTVEQPTTLPTT